MTGTRGTPAVANIPSARYLSATWTDKSGNFWLFGGNQTPLDNGYSLNDLWKFNPSTNEWGWMAGSTSVGQPGVYGTMETPSVQNVPGGRDDASSWTDSNGNFWLFGGYGVDSSGTVGVLNDLWKFNPATGEWTWMSGSSTMGNNCFVYDIAATACAQPGIYGTLGTPAAGNTPGSRQGAITWTDKKGNLWLFGGWSYDVAVQVQYYFDELWEYNISTNQWAWMGGSSTKDGSVCTKNVNLWYKICGEPGVYGTMGTSAPENIPGGRAGAAKWIDSQGNLWLFSGNGLDAKGYFGDPNDVWEFNPSTNRWTWMGGNSTIPPCYTWDCSGPAVYGTQGTPGAGNIPRGRDHAVGWSDSNGNFWLFGGGGRNVPYMEPDVWLNDLWEFNPSTDQWALMGGSIQEMCGVYCSSSLGAVYGGLRAPAPGDNPGIRFGAAGWSDSTGNFWLFGGNTFFVGARYDLDNDFWEYQPSTGPLPTTATPSLSVPTGSYAATQNVTISDATNGAFIYYTTDGTTPTIHSTVFIPSISEPISIQHSKTLKALAAAPGCLTSAVTTGVYTLPPQAATPSFSLPEGTYTSFQTVTISDATPGATIYYTVDGSAPTTSSKVYDGPIRIVYAVTMVRAVAMASGSSLSNIASATYNLNLPYVAAPTFSPPFGTYSKPQTVTISDSTPGATIYYQINTGYPTTGSPVYSGPITVSSSESIWALATATNFLSSGFTGGMYDINPLASQTSPPSFSVGAGTYIMPQTVTISDSTIGALIYYTTDGTTPTTSSSVFSGPITVSSTETIEAIAVAAGYTISPVASATYTIASPSFTLSASPASISVVQGNRATGTIMVTRAGAFSGSVTLSANGLPGGITASFTAGSVAGTQVFTLVASTSAVVTSNPLMITITGTSGSLSATTSIDLTVASPPFTAGSDGTTSITLSPGATTGNTGIVKVVGTNGFSGTVDLSCKVTTSMTSVNNMPTCSLNPTSVTINGSSVQASTLTVNTTAMSSAASPAKKLFWPPAGVTALGFLVFFMTPKRRRGWSALLRLLALATSIAATGCAAGGSGGAGGRGSGNLGTTTGTYTITVSGSSGTISAGVGTIALTVR